MHTPHCPSIGPCYSNKDAIFLFKHLHKRATALGLQVKDLQKLDSLKDLRTSSKYKRFAWIIIGISLISLSLLLISLCFGFPFSDQWVISYIARVKDVENAQCVVENHDILQDLFQPPIECSVCHGVSEISRVSAISPEYFEQHFAYNGVPVVITDAMKNWTAPINFTFDFFKHIYTGGGSRTRHNCQFFPYKTSFSNLQDVFGMGEERVKMAPGFEPWYIGWSNCDPMVANLLRKHYSRPYFLPRQSESSKTDWIFIGTPGYGAHMHIDSVHNPSWQGQVRGHKKWILEPPPECYDVCIPRLEILLNPGDVIVVDTNRWYHSTLVVGDDLSICIGSEYD